MQSRFPGIPERKMQRTQIANLEHRAFSTVQDFGGDCAALARAGPVRSWATAEKTAIQA
jgi:hypothetical protein